MAVSLNYNDMAESTGLLDSANVRITQSNFTMFDYGGKANPTPALHWTLEVLENGEQVEQYWPAGKASDWVPTPDGKGLDAIGNVTKVNKSTNCGVLVKSLMDAGYDMKLLGDGDFSVIEGMECHVDRISNYRKGLENTKDKTILIVTKILSMPGEAENSKKSGSKSKSSSGKKSAGTKSASETTDTPEDEELKNTATECVMDILIERGGEITKTALMMAVQLALKGNPLKGVVNTLLFKGGNFLENGPWNFKDGKLSME